MREARQTQAASQRTGVASNTRAGNSSLNSLGSSVKERG